MRYRGVGAEEELLTFGCHWASRAEHSVNSIYHGKIFQSCFPLHTVPIRNRIGIKLSWTCTFNPEAQEECIQRGVRRRAVIRGFENTANKKELKYSAHRVLEKTREETHKAWF